MKYIIYEATAYPWDVFLFPITVDHRLMHEQVGRGRTPLSAGKVALGHFTGSEQDSSKLIAPTVGSTTLGIKYSKERQEEDAYIISLQFRS